jgi:hypothetical protein
MTLRSDDHLSAWDSRECPFCAETIRRGAKVCPRCRQWLTLRSVHNPVISLWIHGLPHLAILALLGVFMLTSLNRIQNPKPDYMEFPDALEVLESQMIWAEINNEPRIYITGILTNRSAVPWRDIELECRFFDPNGRLLDAAHPHAAVTIQGYDDTAFRAIVGPACPTNLYTSFKVSVSSARNTKGIF